MSLGSLVLPPTNERFSVELCKFDDRHRFICPFPVEDRALHSDAFIPVPNGSIPIFNTKRIAKTTHPTVTSISTTQWNQKTIKAHALRITHPLRS